MLIKEKELDPDLTNEVRGDKTPNAPNESGNKLQTDGSGRLSFLGARPSIPPLPDSPEPPDLSKPEEHQSFAEIPRGIKDSPVNDVEQDPLPPQVNSRPTFSPTVNSPTAVPFANRQNPPLLSAESRFRPRMPFSTKSRPRSTEFRSSEFRPLYLVARHTPRHEPSIENYYSLPSSHSTTRTSSIQDPEEFDLERGPNQIDALDLADPIMTPQSEGRGLVIDTLHSLQGLDLLDSAQPTPTAHSFQAVGQRDASPQAKTMQDLESALVAIPLLSPLFANSNHDPSSSSQHRSQELVRDCNDFSSDHDWKNNFPEYPFQLTEDLPPLPSSRTSSPESVSEPNSLETIIQPIIHSKHEFELPDDLPPLPSSPASSPDLDDILDEPNKSPQSSLCSTKNNFEQSKDFSDLSSIRPLFPDPCLEPAEQRFLSLSKHEFVTPEDLLSMPSSRVSSPAHGDESEKTKSAPQSTRDVRIPGDLPPLPRSRTPTPDLDAQLGQSISMPQLIRVFESPRNLPALPSSRVLSPDNDIKPAPEPETITRPVYSFQPPEDLPALPSSRASSPDLDAVLGDGVLVCQPVNEFEHFEHLPALPSSRASSTVADAKSNLELERKASFQPGYGLERSENLPPLPHSCASSPVFHTDLNEPTISPQSTFEFKRSEDLPALPSSCASSPDAESKSNLELKTKTSPQPVYGIESSEHLPPLPSSRASSPDFDTDFNAEPAISPQSTLEFKRSEDLPALPSSRASSPDAEARSNLELETKTSPQPIHGLEPSEHLPPLPSSRASSPDFDTDLNAKPIISPQSIFEFKRSEDLPTLPSSRASSPDAEAKSNLELERKTSPQPVYGLEPSEHLPPLPSSRASSADIDTDFNDETILSPQSTFEFQRLDDLPALPSSPASSPDADFFHDVETKIPLEPTLEFPSSEDLPALPYSRASSPDAGTFHEMETEVPLEPMLESDGHKYLPPLPVSYASSLETYDTHDIKTETLLEPTFEFQRPENPIKLPSSRTSIPESDIYHDVEKKIPLQPMNLILSFKDLSALPFSRASQKNSSDETERISNKSGSKVMTQEKSITNLGGGLDSNEITGAINAEIAKPSQAQIEMTLQSPDLLTSKENSLDDAKESEFSLQRQPDAENAGTLSTPEKGIDIEPTIRFQESLSSGTLAKGMTGDEDAAVMAVVAEEGTNTHGKRPTTNSKKARRNQKKAKQEDRPQASIRKASDRASVQPQEGVEVDLSSQSFASKDPNMASGESSSEATDLFIQILGTQLSRGENIQIEENAPPIKKGKKGKKNKKQAVQTGPSLKSLVADDSSRKASPQAARAAVLAPIAGESDREGAQMGGSSVETVDQKSLKAASRSETPPVAVALPIDDDFEFLEALPQSPSVRPMDRSSLPDSCSGTTASHVDDHQKTVLEAERPPEAVHLPSDTDLELLAPTQHLETTDGGRYQSKEPETNEAHEPYAMVAELQNSTSGPAIVPKSLESTAGDDLDQVEASPQNALLKKAGESSQEQAQVKDSQSDIPSSPITESLKPDLEPNLAAQFIALPPNDDLDLLEASLPKPSTELTYAEWLEQPEPLIYESPESAPAHEITPTAGPLPDSEDLGLQKKSSQSSSVGSTEQRSPRPGLGEFKRHEEVGSSTQLSKEASVLAPEFTALPSDTNPGLLGYLPQMMSVEVPQLNTQLDESKGDAEASSSKLSEMPIIPAKDITTIANSDPDFLEDLPSQPKESIGISNPAGEPIAKLPKDVYKIQSYPETIALPVDDDPDLLDALPPSPPTDSQSKSINELILRSPTQILRPNVTSEILVLPAAKDFRSLRAPPASSIAGPMPTIPEEILEHEVAPESVNLPSDDDLELIEKLPASPLADPMDSQLEAFQEPNSHSSRDLDEPEVTPHIIADEELDLPDVLSNPETIELPDDEDLDLLEALPPSPNPDTRQVSQVGSITLPETLPLSPPDEHICRSPKVLLKLKANPEISNIPADENFDSRRAIPPSSPVDSSLNPVNEQNFRLTENFLTSEMTPEIIALPADKDFDLLEALPRNTWAGSQQSSVKEASSTPLIHTPEAKDVTQGIRADHDLAEALPPSALDERMEYQADQHEEFPPRSMKESSEPKVTPQAVELPYDDDLDLLEALPPSPPTSPTPELESRVRLPSSPSDWSKEHHVEQLDERTTKGLESGRQTPQSPLSRLVKSKDYFKPAQEPTSTSPVLEVNLEATDLPVSDNLDSLNTLPPSPLTKLTEHQTWSLEETIPAPPEITPSIFACTDGDFGLLKPRPEIFFPDHQTRSMKEPIMNSPRRTCSIVDGDHCLQEPRPEIPSPDHQIGSLEDPIPELLELAPSTVACVDGDLGVLEARPEILSVDQSSQQTDILDERISKWQNELVAESQLPPESIELPADEDPNILADLAPSSDKSIILDGVELKLIEQAPQPEEASRHALKPLNEPDSQILPDDLPLPADDGLESLEALPESPLPQFQVVLEDFPLPTDDVIGLLEVLPKSPLSARVVPQDFPLPTDDDFDLLKALTEPQVSLKDFHLPMGDDLDLLEKLPESPLSEPRDVPEDLPSPTDDIGLLGILSKSPLPESQVVPKDFPLPTDDDLDLLEGLPESLPESPFSESRVVPEECPLPTDNEHDMLEALPTSPLPESQVASRDFPLSTDDDLDLLGALPETPLSESSNKDSDGLEAQHLEAKEQDQDSHHNPIIPDLPEPEVAPENLQLPANDDLDLEKSLQSPLARSIYPDNKDIAPLVIEGLLKEEVKGEVVEEFERAPVDDKGDADKVNGEVGKDAHSVAELGMGGASLETAGIIQDDVVHTGPSLGKNAKKDKKNKKDRKSAVNPIFAPLELQIKPMSVASGSQFIEDIASEPKNDTSAMELEEGNDGVDRQFVADADEELGSGKNNGKKGKKSKSRATTSIVETSIPTSSLPLELPKKSAEDAVFEVLMQDKTKEVTSEYPEILGNDDDIRKEGKRKKKKGKKNQEESSKSGLILEEVELPNASVATEGSKETTESSEKLMTDAEVEGSQRQETIEDEWLNEYKKRGKQRKKAEDNSPPPGDSTDIIEPPSSKSMKRDLDFEDSQAQAVTEDERQKGPKKTVKKGNKSKGKKSKASIINPGVPLMTSPAYPIDDSSSTHVAQIKAFELSLNLPADTKDETSSDGKIYEAGMKQISSFEDTETSELQPGQLESEEIVSEGALQDPQVENELSERNRKKARKEKKQRSKISDTYGEGNDSEKVETSHALSEPMPELIDQLLETCDKEAVEEPRQDHDLTKTMRHKLEYVEPRQGIPESEQVEPGHLETGLIDLEEPQPAQSHSVYIEPIQTESRFGSGESVETNASEPKDSALGQPKSHFMEENPTESSLKLESEPIEKENFTFNATSSVQENGKSTPTPQEPDSPECIPGEVAAPMENMMRKNPSSIVDPELPLHLQVVEHSPTREKNLATTGRKQPTSDAEKKQLDTQKNLPLIQEPATLTQLPPSTDQHPLVLEDSPFPATESSFTKTSEKPQSTAKQPSVREDGPNIGTPSSENPSVTISNTTTLRPLLSDTYPLPTEKLSTIDRSDKPLVLQEESVDIESPLSGKSFVAAKEVSVMKVPSVDELPATVKELAAFESYQSLHQAKEPPVESLDVSLADKSVVGIEEPFIRDVAGQDKHLLAVTDSGPPKTSAVPVQELPVIEAPMSARSSPAMGGYSIATVEEPPVLNVLPPVAKSQLSHIETLSLGPDNHTSSVNEPPLTIQMELISEEDTHKNPSTVEDLTPTSVRDIKRSAVIDNPPNACEDDLLSNANQVSEDILPQDDFAPSKKGKEGKKSKENVTTEQELTVSDGSSAEIKQETQSQQPDENSLILENIIVVPKANKSKGKMALKAPEQEDELDLPDQAPITSEGILGLNSKADPDQFGDDFTSSAALEKQDDNSVLLEDDLTAPIKRSKKGKKGTKVRKQVDDDLAQPEGDPTAPDDPSAILEKQNDELNQPVDDAITPEGLSAVLKKQGQMDEPIGSGKNTKKGKKDSKFRKQRDVDELDQPEVVPISPQDPSTGLEGQEVELDIIEENPFITKDLSGISEKQAELDGSAAPLKKAKKFKESKKARKREADRIDQPEDSSAALDELHPEEDPITPEDLPAVFEKQEDALRAKEDPILPEEISNISDKQEDELKTKEATIVPSALPAIQDRIEETPIALDPFTTEHFSSTVPESQVDEPEQLEDDNIAPNYSYAVKKAKKGKKGKKQEIFNELDQPDENLITSKVRSAALEKQEAEPDQFGKKTRKGKKVKSKRQRFHDLPEEDPLDPGDFSAPELKQADELDQPEEYPVVSGGLSAIHTKQIGPLNQPEEDQVIPEDFSTINTKQINLLDQSEDPIVSESPSALIVDKLDQTQQDTIISEELSAMTKGKLDQREPESIHSEGLSAVPTTTNIDGNIHDPASSENLATGSKSKKGQKGMKAKMPRFDKLDQLKEAAATEDIDRQEDELDQPQEPIAPKYIGALLKQEDEINRPAQESILSEGVASVVTIEKGKKGKNARMQDKHGIEEPKEDFTASEHSAAVIEALQHEDPTTTEKNDAGSIQLEVEVFDRVDGEPVAVKSPTVPERKKSTKGKKSKQENLESAEHEPIASEDTFLPLEDDELGQPGQENIASADTVAEPKAKKSQKGKKEKHVDRLGPSDQTVLAPEAASASQGKLLDRPEQSTIASEESSAPQELSAEIPLKNKSKKSKEPRPYENLDRSDKGPITPKENIASLGNISDVPTSKQVGQDDESIQRSLNVLGPEPSDEASALQENFPEIAIAKSKSDRKSKEQSETGARSTTEEIIATAAGAGVPEPLPNDTRDLALGSISQQLSDNISKRQAEPQYEETKEAETGQQSSDMTPDPTVPILKSRRTETPVAEESRMDNSLGIQAEEATLQEYLIKPQAEREFEDAGIRGKENSLLIEGYREAIQSELSCGNPGDQREKVAVQRMPTTAALDSMPSDVTVQPQNQFPLAELADRDVDHTYPAKNLSSYDANPFIDLERGGDPRRIPEASQTAHPADGDVRLPTPSLEADAAEPHESKRLVEVERPKSSGLTTVSSDIDLNRHTYSEDLIEPEKYVPELLPIDPASKKSTPVEELSAPEWVLKPAKKRKKKESKKNTLGSDSLNAEVTFERGKAEGSEGATLAGDLNLKLTKEIEEDLPEISLTRADIEKSTPVGELGLPEWGLKPAKKGKREKKPKKKNLDSDSINTDEITERESADASEGAALAGDLDLKLAEEFGEDMPEISLTKADVEKFAHEELSDPSWDNKPVKKSKKEKKSKTEAVHSDFVRTREILGEGPAKFSEKAALDRHMDSKPNEGLTVPELEVPALPLTDTDVAEEFSVPEAGLKSAKKIKKEKKSKIKAWDTDSMITGEILGQVPGDIPEDLARDSDLKPSELAGPEQDMPELQQIDNNAEESIPVEDSAIIELRPRPSKKGKKDKKSKSRVKSSISLATEESLDSAASKIPAMEAPTEQNLPELLSTEESISKVDSTRAESGFSLPKTSKNDKKSKDRAIASGSLIPETTEFPKKSPKEHVFREISNADKSISIEDSIIPESRPLPFERSKKDKKLKNKYTVNNILVTQETPEPAASEMTAEIPEEQIVPQFSSTEKSRKSQKAGKKNLDIGYGTPFAVGDNIERRPAEAPLDIPAEPIIPEHEPSTKRMKSKQSKKQGFELGSNIHPLDTELVLQNSQQAAEASRSVSFADHVDEEDSRPVDRTHNETERHQTLMSERKVSQDDREQTYESSPVPTHNEIGADNTSAKMVDFTSEAPSPGGSTPGESTPGESTPAESVTRDSIAPDYSHVNEILPVQHDIQDHHSQGTKASALQKQYPDFFQEESQPHFEDEKHLSGREFEAQELSRNLSDRATENTFNISVEVDPSYGVLISTPSSKQKRSLTVSTPARNDEEAFSNNTRGIESLQTEGEPFRGPGEPSPVSPTTRERSSALFQSSPSTREYLVNRRPEPESPLHDPAEIKDVEYGSRDLSDWIQRGGFSINKSRTTAQPPINLNTSITDGKMGPSDSRGPGSPVCPVSPASFREERTPSRSPFVSDISDTPRLNTIVEYSPEESPLHKKSRSVSDVGSPERGVKFRRRSAVPQQSSQVRMRSPMNPENTARLTAPFEDLTYRLSWPPVDEDHHTVDLERSGSRNTSVSKQSERRSPSGASVGSVESINAIIKTSDAKSSGTPPLRRTDRSVSGDLREAHKKGGAKNLAKRKEAEGQLDITIPSSSTYDPTKDKGKGRVDDMAAVYVSTIFDFHIIYQNHRKLMRS